MRLSILAFACGIALLQVQGELPGAGVLGGLCALALPGFFLCARRQHWAFRIVSLVCCALLGLVWAGWFAQLRLADQLPVAWEAREIEIIGVIASLPQRFERGERYELRAACWHCRRQCPAHRRYRGRRREGADCSLGGFVAQ